MYYDDVFISVVPNHTVPDKYKAKCPFCGSIENGIIEAKGGGFKAKCAEFDCGAIGPLSATSPEHAFERWLKREGEK